MEQHAGPLDRMPPSPPVSIQSRHLFMTDADWTGFAAALVEHFPLARYLRRDDGPLLVTTDRPPEFEYRNDLFSANGWLPATTTMVFDPAWQPDFVQYLPFPDKSSECWWLIHNHPRPAVRFHVARPGPVGQIKTLQGMGANQVDFYIVPGHREQAALRTRFFRLLGKYASNRNQERVRYPEYEVMERLDRGSRIWLGNEAISWAREDGRRLFFYSNRNFAYRPQGR